MEMMSKPSSSQLPPDFSTTTVPADHIVLSVCQSILYGTVHDSAIRIFDVLLLVPNVLFLMFLMYRLGVAHVQLYEIRCPIVKTVYFMVFFVCIVGIIRCFVSMLLTSILNEPHKDSLLTKILWLLLCCFLLAVELSVIIFGVWAGNMQDGRKGVQRVLCVSSLFAIAYSSAQATLEFIRCPGINGKIYGKTKYDLYGHGGLLFMASTSLFLALVYFVIVILPCTKLRERCIIPERKSFYVYCGVLCVVNLLQGCTSLLLYESITQSLCVLDFTMILYYTMFGPMVYWTFLKDFFRSTSDFPDVLRVGDSYSYSYLPAEDTGLESGSDNEYA
ncbi:transmembrane protein adipocyte-associated 1 homolog isoform X3 [Orbicella faveolata]|uniref:transmembrane protein adipocyte-associated 1 homolog isoform X3 n=1 Tax=Orbicella faveolata TaxID=48498 RepID=UPI0009E5832C|nr:transmembrane protein adipocyte-associated 1 homolog isoform X3 [Orbicella faveolata]